MHRTAAQRACVALCQLHNRPVVHVPLRWVGVTHGKDHNSVCATPRARDGRCLTQCSPHPRIPDDLQHTSIAAPWPPTKHLPDTYIMKMHHFYTAACASWQCMPTRCHSTRQGTAALLQMPTSTSSASESGADSPGGVTAPNQTAAAWDPSQSGPAGGQQPRRPYRHHHLQARPSRRQPRPSTLLQR